MMKKAIRDFRMGGAKSSLKNNLNTKRHSELRSVL